MNFPSTMARLASGVTEPRAPVSGFSQGWLESLSPLVSTSEAALRAKARSVSVGAGPCPGPIAPVTSLSSILAKAPSERERLQPPEPMPIRNRVATAPAGRIADRPTRAHVLYRASLHWACNACWDATERNSELRHDGHD